MGVTVDDQVGWIFAQIMRDSFCDGIGFFKVLRIGTAPSASQPPGDCDGHGLAGVQRQS